MRNKLPDNPDEEDFDLYMRYLIDPRTQGQYTHNQISLVLRMIAKKYGKLVANRFVGEYHLERDYNIHCEK